jgi:hypothetical protein
MSRTTSVARDAFAGCFECHGSEAIWWTKNCQGIAARHHDATGHTTWVEVNMSIKYGEGKRMSSPKIAREALEK